MSIVAVSDVHLGMRGAKEKDFIDFIEYIRHRRIDHLVLLGDIVDIWRRDFTKAVMECSKSLSILNDMLDETEVHYVVGNHDFYLLRMSEVLKDNFPFKVKKHEVIKDINQEFFFFHGYQLEVLCNPYYKSMKTYEAFSEHMCLAGDDAGNAAEMVWEEIQSKRSFWDTLKRFPSEPKSALQSMMEPPEKRIRNYHRHNVIEPIMELAAAKTRHFLLNVRPEQYLIYGHTHLAYVDDRNKVANTGSWGFGDKKDLEYIEIVDDKVKVKEFKP
ncbi:UDP-2,3-diacylglucosamine diphosphatase [Methanolobus bombayensis]|uniref:UDP-2,3-diacylglucosamine diphosphatase n=1 Tax=Methanolobus bombayensis TaxID=38023 RepID=UPI001AE3BB6B|nr:UDP-2,3-diacylglucosamine diphosphatase [Methanolobus bombayensis]MBP1909359.1 UDP-2,3-diacylglucosamine pyrophosphatase LpxH [Methanolobus bombayensis]